MAFIRTFIAVEISQETRDRAAQLVRTLSDVPGKIKWVDPDLMHVTLKFLGDTAEEMIPDICQAVKEAAAETPAFSAAFRGVSAFPSVARPRTVWLGADEGAEEFVELQRRIDEALAVLNIPREGRRFKPHLTIARVRQGSRGLARLTDLLREHADFNAGRTIVDEVVTFSSELTREGPLYTAMSRSMLA